MARGRVIDREPKAPVEWYVAHISGCLATFAAKLGLGRIEQAVARLQDELFDYWQGRDWLSEYEKPRIQLGQHPDGEGGEDVPF